MSKIKKVFSFLPAIVLTILSGLTAFLSKGNVTSAYADSLVLVSSHSLSNYGVDYNVSNGSVHLVYSYDAYLYRNSLDNTYNYVVYVTFHNGDSYVYLNSQRFNGRNQEMTYSLTFNSLVDNGAATSTRALELRFDSILSESSLFYVSNDVFYGNGAHYFFNVTYTLFMTGFTSKTISLPVSWGSDLYSYMFNIAATSQYYSYFTSSSLDNTSLRNSVMVYNVDLTQSNYDVGYSDGYSIGYDDGFNSGYASGNNEGYSTGYSAGFTAGSQSREQDITNAYTEGYSAGITEADNQSAVANSIFDGVIRIGILPVQFFLSIFNFEVFGINVSVIITSLLAVCITIILIRFITGKKA